MPSAKVFDSAIPLDLRVRGASNNDLLEWAFALHSAYDVEDREHVKRVIAAELDYVEGSLRDRLVACGFLTIEDRTNAKRASF
jgi:hypothetical protein